MFEPNCLDFLEKGLVIVKAVVELDGDDRLYGCGCVQSVCWSVLVDGGQILGFVSWSHECACSLAEEQYVMSLSAGDIVKVRLKQFLDCVQLNSNNLGEQQVQG